MDLNALLSECSGSVQRQAGIAYGIFDGVHCKKIDKPLEIKYDENTVKY
jgi:hypothetical protein